MKKEGVVEQYSGPVFLSRCFTVPKRGTSETRLVVDLSRLNQFIQPKKFKMVSVAQARELISPNSWLTSIYLTDAYWHVPIHRRYRKFLAIQQGHEVLCFRVLPFGLSLASRVFTLLT